MCMFCAAIPMSLSVGVALAGKEREKRHKTGGNSRTSSAKYIVTYKGIVFVTGGLVVCSAVYHLVIMPHTGAVI